MSIWKEYARPVTVLLSICLVAGLVLASVNAITAPVIAANEEEKTNATYYAALPEAEGFTALPCDLDGVTAVLQATNGVGYVICAQAQGYGGQVPAAVALSPQGEILTVIFMDNDETPGMGQKVTGDDFARQFSGRPAQALSLEEIDTISGATISSRAAVTAVNRALAAYEQVKEETP